ncbi:MAG: LON peptidase substrate-binding domain-containing protein [Myxococcota bacterium]|nr:LON peptidase substrate-binding domain-containing protein [Myxococcota bacterium]MDW8361838.1 LON peptidase substrate-binding domain-containing protein [Myxococcales bacterium]
MRPAGGYCAPGEATQLGCVLSLDPTTLDPLAPLTAQELAALPLFPLPRAVVLPGTSVALHVFEPRYRAMVRHCLEHGRAMALVRIRRGHEKEQAGEPPIHDVAGAGRIVAHRANPDGTSDIVFACTTRVRIEELPFQPPFRRAKATVLEDIATDPRAVTGLYAELLRHAPFVVAATAGAAAPAYDVDGDAGRLADRLLGLLVEHPDERQRMLETAGVEQRLATALATVHAIQRARGRQAGELVN